jgi:PKD repeat protein
MKTVLQKFKIGVIASVLVIFTPSCKKELPSASFDFSPITGEAPLNVSFTNKSTNATSYSWDFGDGTTSTSINPSHRYSYGGNFTITLVASNGKNSSTITKSIYVRTPVQLAPIADFSFSPNSGAAPLEVSFFNYSQNATSYYWDFGNGKSSTLSDPVTTYSIGGTYNITLTATGKNGQQNKMVKTISVGNAFKPTRLKINYLTLTNFPSTDNNGSSWDFNSGPEIYAFLTDDAGNDFGKTSYYVDVLKSNLPLKFQDFTTTINNLDYKFIIEFNDYDDLDADDWMGGYYFTPSNFIPSSGSLPTKLNFSSPNSEITFTLDVTWL